MVLSQHRGFRFSFAVDDGADSLNPFRILATSAALALHAAVLLILLAPAAMPEPEVAERRWTPPDMRAKVDPPPPPPIQAPVVPPQPVPTATVAPRPPLTILDDASIVSDLGTEPYVPPAADPLPATAADIGPPSVAAVRLEYVDAPAPDYPRAAMRAGRQGTVLLQVTVGIDGRPVSVEIAQSSGHRDLDATARNQVLKHWRFRAAMKDGQAIQAIGMVPVNFTLN